MRVARPRVPRESTARGGGCTRLARLPAQPRPACARSALCALPTVAGLLPPPSPGPYSPVAQASAGAAADPVPSVYAILHFSMDFSPSSRPAYVYRIDYRMAENDIVVAGTGLDPPRVRTSLFGRVGSLPVRRPSYPTRPGGPPARARVPARRLSAPLRRTGVYCFHVGFLTIRAGTMPTACRPSASRGRLHHWGCPAPSS